ncbi:UNVERIFIED_ORG: cytoskeletal protein CcmA (bactofilin family) [Rahnella aquatilis]
MRTETALWTFWFAWVLWILSALYPEMGVIKWLALLTTGWGGVLCFPSLVRKKDVFMRLLKRESKTIDTPVQGETSVKQMTDTPAESALPSSILPEGLEMIKPVRTRKDTFISPEAHLSGNLEGQGNIVIEGRLEGNIRSSHQVRVESGGQVVGDIHAQHIVINGRVEGRFFAGAITLQPEGHVQGDIITDVLIIEKGGVFIGQSQLKPQEAVKSEKGNITTLNIPLVQDTSSHID